MFRLRDDDPDSGDTFDPNIPFDTNDPDAEDDDALGHEAAASLDDTYRASCPYCMEENEVFVDLGGGSHQSYVEDCQV